MTTKFKEDSIKGYPMNIIFYSSTTDKRTTEICRGIENSCPDFGMEQHHSIRSLESRLRQPLNGIALLLLYLSDKNDLSDMLALQELIIDLPTIVITIDGGGEAMPQARLLRPRFIFGPSHSLEEMCLIFEKMLARAKERWTTTRSLN